MVDKLRKIFIVFAIVAVAVMGMPVKPAKAVTVASGDLIKASGAAVYYYAEDGKRYVFPNEKTYRTWYPDFSTVKTITDAELASIQIEGNVVYRPGARLGKVTTDPKVYAVGPNGVLHWITSESVATDLYGPNWADMVDDIPDAFFTNYSYGSDITSAVHPEGTLIKYAASSDIYVIEEGEKRLVADEAAFNANMFMEDYVYTIADTITYPTASTDLTTAETTYTDVAQLGGSTTPVVSGDLDVAVSSETPASFTAPRGGVGIEVAKFNFSAGNEDVALNGLTLSREGIGNSSDIERVYLYNGTNKLTSGRSLSSTTQTAVFTNLGLTIPANSTVTLTVKVDTSSTAVGGDHRLVVNNANHVDADATIGGSFPVSGNTFSISGSVNVGLADIESNGSNYTRKVGEANVEVGNFSVHIDNTENAQVESITLYNGGRDILSDFNLYRGSTLIATGTQDGDYIRFDLSTPYEILKGDSANFTVKANVSGRDGDTATLSVRYKTDVVIKGLTYGYPLGVDVTVGSSATGSYVDQVATTLQSNTTTAEAGQITASFNGPVASDVAKNSNDVVLMDFALTAGSDAEVEKSTINIAGTNLVAGDLEELELVCNDVIVANWSTVTIGDNVSTDYWSLPAGGVNCQVRVDITNTAAGDETITATLKDLTANWTFKDANTGDTLTDIVPTGNIAGNAMSVTSASLTVNTASTPAAGNIYVPRSAEAEMVSFLLEAGDASDVKVTDIRLKAFLDDNGAWNKTQTSGVNDIITVVRLYNEAGDPIGTTESLTVGSANVSVTFDSLELNIPAGGTEKILVSADISSTAPKSGNPDKVAFALDTITAEYGSAGSALSATIAGNNATPSIWQKVVTTGSLTASAHADMPNTNIIEMANESLVNKIKFAATNEDIVVEKLAMNYNGKDGAGEGSTVVAGDDDITTGLTTLTNAYITGGDATWAAGECVYDDTGSVNADVDAGDIRITSCATYPAGSTVVAGDSDIAAAVLNAATNLDGTGAATWVAGDDVYDAAGATVAAGDTRVTAAEVTNALANEFAKGELTYTNSAGNTATAEAWFIDGVAKFSGLDIFVPKNGSVAVDFTVHVNDGTTADNYDNVASLPANFNLATTDFRSVTSVSGVVSTSLSGSAAGNNMYVFEAYPSFEMGFSSTDSSRTLTPNTAFEIGDFMIAANGDKDVTFTSANEFEFTITVNGATAGTTPAWSITDGSQTLCSGTTAALSATGNVTVSCGFNNNPLTIGQNSSKHLYVKLDTQAAGLGPDAGDSVSVSFGETNDLDWGIDGDGNTWGNVTGNEISNIIFNGTLSGGTYQYNP